MTLPPPAWLAELLERVSLTLAASDLLAPLGCHYFHNQDDDEWEVTLFAARSEVLGGEADGQQSYSLFTLDLLELQACFTTVESCGWQNLPVDADDELGNHVSLIGMADEYRVWLRILGMPPPRFDVGRVIDVHNLRLEDLW